MADEPANTASETPSPGDAVAMLNELIAAWEAHGPSVEVPVIDGGVLVGVAVEAQVEHAVRLSEAVVVLAGEGHFIQMAPLIRGVLECAVTAAWWTLNPANAKASLVEAGRLKNALMRSMSGISGRPFEPHPDWRRIQDDYSAFKAAEAHQFEQRCAALSGGSSLYPYYRLLSEASHAGIALTDEYIVRVPESHQNPYGIEFVRHAPYAHRDIALVVCVLSLAFAMRAWDDITSTHPDRLLIDDIAARIGAVIVVQPNEPDSVTSN